MRVTLGFMTGEGLDDVRLARALELEDQQTVTPLVFRPSVQNALLLEWTGELDRAQEALEAIRLRCMEKGEEGEYVFIAQHVVMSAIWRGDFVNAASSPRTRWNGRSSSAAIRRSSWPTVCARRWRPSPATRRSPTHDR